MASQIASGGADVAGLWTEYINREFVPGLKAKLLFANYCRGASIPRGAGGYIGIWNVPTMRDGSVTPLGLCSSGSATDMITITKVTAAVTSYGEYFEIDDLADQTEIAGALDEYRDMVEYAGASAIDSLVRNAAYATTNFLHCGDAAAAGVTLVAGNQLKALDLPVIEAFFNGNNAQGFPSLSGDHMLAIHPQVEKTLVTHVTTAELSWSEVNKHVPRGFDQLIDNHSFVGRLTGVSVLRTTKIGTITEDVAAYRCLAMADWGVGWLGVGQKGPKRPMIKLKRPGPQSTNDPLDMCMTLGWKVQAIGKLLDANRVLTVYSAVDAA